MSSEKKTYYAQAEGWALGVYRQCGEEVPATKEEAKYPLMAGVIGTERPKAAKRSVETKPAAAEPVSESKGEK